MGTESIATKPQSLTRDQVNEVISEQFALGKSDRQIGLRCADPISTKHVGRIKASKRSLAKKEEEREAKEREPMALAIKAYAADRTVQNEKLLIAELQRHAPRAGKSSSNIVHGNRSYVVDCCGELTVCEFSMISRAKSERKTAKEKREAAKALLAEPIFGEDQ